MRPQTLAVVMLALISGLGAVWGVRSMQKKSTPPPEEMVPVVFATADLPRGEAIDKARVEVRSVPKSQAPEGGLSKVEDAASRTPSITMLKGEHVLELKLLPKGSRSGMASLIPPGMRAFTIQTPTSSSSLAGLIQPGNRVDVLLTFTTTGGVETDSTSTTLLQKVEVLAVDAMFDPQPDTNAPPNPARSITLLVTPRQAATLDLAQSKGTLHLSLRNALDDAAAEETSAKLVDLGVAPPAPPVVETRPEPSPPLPPEPAVEPAPVPVVLTVRTLRGTHAGQDEITVLKRNHPRVAVDTSKKPAPAAVSSPR